MGYLTAKVKDTETSAGLGTTFDYKHSQPSDVLLVHSPQIPLMHRLAARLRTPAPVPVPFSASPQTVVGTPTHEMTTDDDDDEAEANGKGKVDVEDEEEDEGEDEEEDEEVAGDDDESEYHESNYNVTTNQGPKVSSFELNTTQQEQLMCHSRWPQAPARKLLQRRNEAPDQKPGQEVIHGHGCKTLGRSG